MLAATVVSAATAVVTFTATPALAVSGLLVPTIGLGNNGPHHVTAHCTPGAGVALGLNQITYVVEATASSFSTNGSLALGTSLTCYAYNIHTYRIYASISGGLPGDAAAAVGTMTVPTSADVSLCIKATALFNDNAAAHFDSCPF